LLNVQPKGKLQGGGPREASAGGEQDGAGFDLAGLDAIVGEQFGGGGIGLADVGASVGGLEQQPGRCFQGQHVAGPQGGGDGVHAGLVIAEAITNIAKHASARSATVTVGASGDNLRVVIEDDGTGGARLEPGGGLAGLAVRIRSIDGTFTVSSPPGGPTRVEAVIPCER
jgi:hypothetical protein